MTRLTIRRSSGQCGVKRFPWEKYLDSSVLNVRDRPMCGFHLSTIHSLTMVASDVGIVHERLSRGFCGLFNKRQTVSYNEREPRTYHLLTQENSRSSVSTVSRNEVYHQNEIEKNQLGMFHRYSKCSVVD